MVTIHAMELYTARQLSILIHPSIISWLSCIISNNKNTLQLLYLVLNRNNLDWVHRFHKNEIVQTVFLWTFFIFFTILLTYLVVFRLELLPVNRNIYWDSTLLVDVSPQVGCRRSSNFSHDINFGGVIACWDTIFNRYIGSYCGRDHQIPGKFRAAIT